MLAAVGVAAWVATMGAAPQSSSVPQDAVPFARRFLQAFAVNPQSTRQLVTSDALLVFIGTPSPYSDFLKRLTTKKTSFAACELQSLRETSTPTMEELKNLPAASFKTQGHFAIVHGVYACKRPDVGKVLFGVTMILKNSLVAEFRFFDA